MRAQSRLASEKLNEVEQLASGRTDVLPESARGVTFGGSSVCITGASAVLWICALSSAALALVGLITQSARSIVLASMQSVSFLP